MMLRVFRGRENFEVLDPVVSPVSVLVVNVLPGLQLAAQMGLHEFPMFTDRCPATIGVVDGADPVTIGDGPRRSVPLHPHRYSPRDLHPETLGPQPSGFAVCPGEYSTMASLARLLFRHGSVLPVFRPAAHLSVVSVVVRTPNLPPALGAPLTRLSTPVDVRIDRSLATPQILESLHETPPFASRCPA